MNTFVPWPASWTERRYNAGNEPCDMLSGPCACGAWHSLGEDWVQALFRYHQGNAMNKYCPNCGSPVSCSLAAGWGICVCGWQGHLKDARKLLKNYQPARIGEH
jgi:hypothetical protein